MMQIEGAYIAEVMKIDGICRKWRRSTDTNC